MFYIKKIAKMIFSIYIISTISFFIISLIPGEPATSILGVDASYENLELLRKTLGLDKPLITRYFLWLKKAIMGDFGISFKYSQPVKDLILERLPLTIAISLISLAIIFTISILLSFYLNKKKKYSKFWDIILNLSISIPSFWIGIIFIFVFSVMLRLTSVSYNNTITSLIFPCIIISIPKIGHITKNIKENLYVETRQEYVKYLYSNGMKLKYLNLYVLKNSLLQVLSIFGLIIIDLITGIVIVEQIFSIPGIGRLMTVAVYTRDIPLVQALIVYTSFVIILINFLVDVLYSVLDPRIKLGDVK
ncbi:ABC transporter permease [Caviibacter abscessus]|uniref:ABC transporter permease n=1 Tax=Caviibacter abscessus TaxID=1766719 RepID=UPI0008386322|nr:ABC transporter permease [Caviibacter abscessus]